MHRKLEALPVEATLDEASKNLGYIGDLDTFGP